ncbi:MAG: type IV secretion system DNA-binding domain-containing protein [Verrucomicrobiaceae bacterium]|nr:type IV secretion system DNA-binding domain-containing protein [Verrucomicrobiaceae bacterium]
MKSVRELQIENILRWEQRGRGTLLFDHPVSPRPPFTPFPGHQLKDFARGKDSARHTRASGLLAKLGSLLRGEPSPPPLPEQGETQDEFEPDWVDESPALVELQMRLPEAATFKPESMTPFLTSLGFVRGPLTFEIIGTAEETFLQWAVMEEDEAEVREQMNAHFPDVKINTIANHLSQLTEPCEEMAVVEFALAEPFMLPLNEVKHDPFVPLAGSLASLPPGEVGLFQVIFTPVEEPWAEEAHAAITRGDGRPLFEGDDALVKALPQKTSGQLYGVVLRLAAFADSCDRAWAIVRGMAPALRYFTSANGNQFTPLPNEGYDLQHHREDVLFRCCRRGGMLLNQSELNGLAHLPSSAVQSKKLRRIDTSTRAVSSAVRNAGVCIGNNPHDGDVNEVRLSPEQRVRHCHIIGGTGTGKSTLLFSMIEQDITSGQGIAVLDPHGDLIDRVLSVIPPGRVKDVVLFDPADEQSVIPFNILSAHSDFEKQLLASDLVSVFQRLSTSWGDQMNSVFQNTVLAFLESSEGGTLADLRRFLLDTDWRSSFLQTVTDPDVRFYWQRAFPQLGGGKSIGPIITRLETFLSPKPIRYMVSQKENRLDFGAMMDTGKIFLAKLPQGQIGRENAFLLGSLVMTKLQQMAMSRARVPASNRRPFYCYIDEFHHFIAPSLTEILSGARKYGLGLVLAHQELRQLDRDKEVASAVLSNAFTRIVFRVGDADARALADGFAHFEARHLQSLGIGQAIARIERADNDFNIAVPLPGELNEEVASQQREASIAASQSAYALPRKEVEAELLRQLEAMDSKAAAPRTAKMNERVREAAAKVIAPVEPISPVEGSVSEVIPTHQPAGLPRDDVTSDPSPPESPVALEVSRSSGMGRGGLDHQVLVEQFSREGMRLGYQSTKECQVGRGRVDLVLQRGRLRIGIEVAVNSNTSHELDNLRKGLEESFNFVVSVSPLPNVMENIRRAAQKALPADDLARLLFMLPEDLVAWLSDQAREPVEDRPSEKRVAGRRVLIKHAELSPEERRRIEEESLAAVAEAIRRRCSTVDS